MMSIDAPVRQGAKILSATRVLKTLQCIAGQRTDFDGVGTGHRFVIADGKRRRFVRMVGDYAPQVHTDQPALPHRDVRMISSDPGIQRVAAILRSHAATIEWPPVAYQKEKFTGRASVDPSDGYARYWLGALA